MDFQRVLVTDKLAWEIFGAAAREQLLFTNKPEEHSFRRRPGASAQRALSLLVLFDRLVIHDFGEGTLRIPDLEKEGIVEVLPGDWKPGKMTALGTKWKKGRLGSRGRPPKSLLQSLALVQQFRPLVINRLLTGKIDFIDMLSDALRVSRRRSVELFLDYSIAYIQGDRTAVRSHVLNRILGRSLKEQLFAFSDPLNSMNAILLFAVVFAEEIAVIQDLASKTGLPVATEHYQERFLADPALTGKQVDALSLVNRFMILRAAFVEEGRFLPPIDSLKHALKLRKDPHLRAVRSQLQAFHYGVTAGDRQGVTEARSQIQKAIKKLKGKTGWDKTLRWLAYASVPAGIAEGLLWGTPVVGTSISVIGAAGAAASRRTEKKNEWVLFGT
jgi:hypothetical protein